LEGHDSVFSFDIAGPATGVAGTQFIAYGNGSYNNHLSFAINVNVSYTNPPSTGGRITIPIPAANANNFKNGGRFRISMTCTNPGDIYLGNVVWEKGSTASADPEFMSLPLEILRCQQYYQSSYPLNVGPGLEGGGATGPTGLPTSYRKTVEVNTSYPQISCPFPGRMRRVPDIRIFSPDSGEADHAFNYSTSTSISAIKPSFSTTGFETLINAAATVALQEIGVHWDANAELIDS
jgi:hypothetical protein